MKNNRPSIAQIVEFANDMWEAGTPVSRIAVYLNGPTMERHDVAAGHRITRNQTRFMGFDISAVFAIAVDELDNACVLLRDGSRHQILACEAHSPYAK